MDVASGNSSNSTTPSGSSRKRATQPASNAFRLGASRHRRTPLKSNYMPKNRARYKLLGIKRNCRAFDCGGLGTWMFRMAVQGEDVEGTCYPVRGAERWFAVQTQPHAEDRARLQLANQKFRAFLPKRECTIRHARRMMSAVRPFFPRYLFVVIDLTAINGAASTALLASPAW